jgi:exodeoxyribonuclease-3
MIVSPIKIVALNINSGGGTRIASLCAYLDARQADIVVLTEWRGTTQGRKIADWAAGKGLHCQSLTDGATATGVFLAAKASFTPSSVTPDGGTPGVMMLAQATAWTLLACYFPHKELKRPFFAAVAHVAAVHADEPLIVVGDLNTGNQIRDRSKDGARFHCTVDFDALSEKVGLIDLWRLTHVEGAQEYSWLSAPGNGFRIDHAFANEIFVREMQPVCHYDHGTRIKELTDHSALIVACGVR